MVAAGLAGPRIAEAKGWEEVHQTSDDVRVSVGADGVAVIQHHLRYRIVAGRFKTLDFAGLDPHRYFVFFPRLSFSAIRALTSFRTRAVGRGSSAGKRMVPVLVS